MCGSRKLKNPWGSLYDGEARTRDRRRNDDGMWCEGPRRENTPVKRNFLAFKQSRLVQKRGPFLNEILLYYEV